MLNITLVRHGEAEGNTQQRFLGVTDAPLTARGIEQAESTANRLGKFDFIYSSPLQRAYRTAQIIVDGRYQKEIFQIDELKERNFGIFENMTIPEMEKINLPVRQAWTADLVGFRIPEGESMEDLRLRAACAAERILQGHTAAVQGMIDEEILIVSHLNTLRMILVSLLDLPITDGQKFFISNAGIVRLNVSVQRTELVFE